MTMLYRLDASAPVFARAFDAILGEDQWGGGYVAPGKFAPIITAGREFIAGPRPSGPKPRPRIIPRYWGVPPPPGTVDGNDPTRGVTTVSNVDSPFWIGNLRNAEFRCLIPATAFMEWGAGRTPDGQRRRNWFGVSDQPVFAFAGVWKDSEVPSFAILSCPSNALLKNASRQTMPVILPADPAAHHIWLHGSWKRAEHLVTPYSSSMMRVRGDPGRPA